MKASRSHAPFPQSSFPAHPSLATKFPEYPKVKELALINEDLRKAADCYKSLIEGRRKNIIESGQQQFSTRMKEHGFNIKQGANRVEADYHGARVILLLPDISDQPIGALVNFKVTQNGNTVHLITAMHGRSGFSISTTQTPTANPDAIETAMQRLEEVQQTMVSANTLQVEYRVHSEGDSTSVLNTTAHPCFTSSLDAILNLSQK